ncbi:MAG: hypothetical protein MSA55_04910, partial [Coriobacteriaceae bacterium]|nr:hypothetical protein [Coriobacteriaceae bacterium]
GKLAALVENKNLQSWRPSISPDGKLSSHHSRKEDVSWRPSISPDGKLDVIAPNHGLSLGALPFPQMVNWPSFNIPCYQGILNFLLRKNPHYPYNTKPFSTVFLQNLIKKEESPNITFGLYLASTPQSGASCLGDNPSISPNGIIGA